MVVANVIKGSEYRDPKITTEYFRIESATVYIGMSLYAYEAVATLFTIRNTMRKPKQLVPLIAVTFTIIVSMFILLGSTCYYVFFFV